LIETSEGSSAKCPSRESGFPFPAAAEQVSIVRGSPYQRFNLFYLANPARIVVGELFEKYPDGLMREFTHHVLSSDLPSSLHGHDRVGLQFIENALADYYPCSFKDDPETIAKVAEGVLKQLSEFDPPPRSLKNDRKLTEATRTMTSITGVVIWGGAFWQLRQQIGKNEADRLLRSVWLALRQDKMTNDPLQGAKSFVQRLIDQAPAAQREKIRRIFQDRGLEL
jgi:hypothetical protein